MRHNIGYKLLSLLIGILVWAYVNQYVDQGRQITRVSRELALPVTVRNLADGLVVTSKPAIVKVALSGPQEYVDSIIAEPDSVTANVFLNSRGRGRHTLPIIVKLPEGYTGLVSTSTNPPRIAVGIEKMARKLVKVEAEFAASPPVGFKFSSPEIAPGRVIVSGRSEMVNRVVRCVVTVDPTSETGQRSVLATLKPVDMAGEEVPGITTSVNRVRVSLQLERAPVSKVVFITPSITGRPPFPYKVISVEVSPQSVTLNGRPERLMQISTVATEPLVLGAHTKTFSQRVQLIAPSGTSLASGHSATITVRIGTSDVGGSEVAP